MKFKTIAEVIQKLQNNQKVPQWVIDSRKYHADLKAYVYGDGFRDKLLQIEHIESSKKAKARKKYSRPITDLNERILRTIDNVYSATGGIKKYYENSKNDTKKKALLQAVNHNRDNKSIEKWLQDHWSKDLYITDPGGVVFLEYDSKTDKPPYPTYKSIDVIRNYEYNGQNLEWIIFEPYKELVGAITTQYIRVVDDVMDMTFAIDGDKYTLIPDRTFKHPFGKVPGLINSNIIKIGYSKRFSMIDTILPLEAEFMRDQSVLTIYKFLNGFSTPIRPVIVCQHCHGSGKTGTDSCTDCNGKGHVLREDVTDEILIPISLDREEGYNLPTGLFSYMSPPLEIWNQYNDELEKLEAKAVNTLWGTHKEKYENERTAFETFVDTQPVTTKLSEISEVSEFMEWQLTEWIANFLDPTKGKDERTSLISYGKMFIIEPPEAIMDKYRTNKEKGVTTVVLDRQLIEYLTSKYKNNPTILRIELLKKELEFYVHYTVDQVRATMGEKEAMKKMMFTDFWESLDAEQIKTSDIKQLEIIRDTWMDEKIMLIEGTPNEPDENEDDQMNNINLNTQNNE